MLAVGVVGGGLAVVTLRNVIHSAIAMMVCFGSLAGMYLLLGAGIIAAAQVLIYLGGHQRPDPVRHHAHPGR